MGKEQQKKGMTLAVVNVGKVIDSLTEDPIIVSGLSFDKESYTTKVKMLKEVINSKDASESDKNKAKIAMILYRMALNLEVPASGITILGGNPYINTAGLLYKTFKIAEKYGGIKSLQAIPQTISDEVSKPAFFIGRVEMKDGTIFEDFGEASVANIKMSTIRPFLNSMAARRATNRAMRLATGIGLVSAEEMESEVHDTDKPNERLLTQKEMEGIMDLVSDVEGAVNLDKLSEVEKALASKKGLNEFQIAMVKKVINNKKTDLTQ